MATHIRHFSAQPSARLRRPFERCRSELELHRCHIGPGGSHTESAHCFSPPDPTECSRRNPDKLSPSEGTQRCRLRDLLVVGTPWTVCFPRNSPSRSVLAARGDWRESGVRCP